VPACIGCDADQWIGGVEIALYSHVTVPMPTSGSDFVAWFVARLRALISMPISGSESRESVVPACISCDTDQRIGGVEIALYSRVTVPMPTSGSDFVAWFVARLGALISMPISGSESRESVVSACISGDTDQWIGGVEIALYSRVTVPMPTSGSDFVAGFVACVGV
jgi:hypothetical protein